MQFFRIKALDVIIFFFFTAVLLMSVLLLNKGKQDEKHLIIRSPEGEFIYSLSKDSVYKIEGAVGISEIEVKDGKASFKDSPCPSKTCVMTGEISGSGEWAACLPNEIFIRIEGGESELDAVSQ